MTATKKLKIKGHKLATHWTGVQSSYANGSCECGWFFNGWSHKMRSVRIQHQFHLQDVAAAEKAAS